MMDREARRFAFYVNNWNSVSEGIFGIAAVLFFLPFLAWHYSHILGAVVFMIYALFFARMTIRVFRRIFR
jgi:hypothetical protein